MSGKKCKRIVITKSAERNGDHYERFYEEESIVSSHGYGIGG